MHARRMPSSQPDWASLPLELWTKVLQALPAQGDQVQQCRQLATLSIACKALRSAVLGPDAGVLWRMVSFASVHPGLDASQSRQLNRLLASQARHASHVVLTGGGWDLEELRAAAASLDGPYTQRLHLHAVHTAAEAKCLSSVLPSCLVRALNYAGSQALSLPTSLQALQLFVSAPPGHHVGDLPRSVSEQTHRALQELQLLTRLTSLFLVSPLWRLQQADAACLTAECLPHLIVLDLTLYVSSNFGPHAVESLSGLSASVRLSLTLISTGASLTPLLQALRSVRLYALTLECTCITRTPYGLTPVDEAHLARCSITEQLTLRMQPSTPAERLQGLLPAVKVVHVLPS